MPFPLANSYTQTKWLAFFAELTAKLTHHNVLVVMEGAELLKRLLISRVSIAAVLQQGELLVRLLDSWRGCVNAECSRTGAQLDSRSTNSTAPESTSAAIALNGELSFVLAESISQCIDLMCSLYADGDSYYCLLVLARAGPMLEVLVDVLQTAPPQLYGITASLLQQLLSLPLGHSEVELVTANDGGEVFVGLDKATLAQLQKSVSLRLHIRVLVQAIQEHGALLQQTTDSLAGLLAVQQGPRCLAAVYLFNLASKRLRKFELRHGQVHTDRLPSPSLAGGDNVLHASCSDAQDPTDDNSELNVTITGAPQAAAGSSVSPSSKAKTLSQPATSVLDDLEDGVESSLSTTSLKPAPLTSCVAASTAAAAAGSSGASPPAHTASGATLKTEIDAVHEKRKPNREAAPQDVSAVVDAEPVRYVCTVPPSLAEESLRHLAASRTHEAFFDALDWLWCLTVADAAVVGAAFTPELLTQGLGRYLKTAPRTRRDRMLFTLLLLWLGHLHSISALRQDTHRRLLDTAALSLLPMLKAELCKEGSVFASSNNPLTTARHAASTTASLNVSAITATDANNNSTSGMTSAMALAASTGYGVSSADTQWFSSAGTAGGGLPIVTSASPPSTDAWRAVPAKNTALHMDLPNGNETTLLPYAAVRNAQTATLLSRPSIEVILLAFLLNIYSGIDAEARHEWVCEGRVLDVALVAVCRAGGVRSALLDTPTTIDGALSDEIYLDYALRSARTDVTTVAVLGCRLMAAVLGSELRWGPGWRDAQQGREAETSNNFTSNTKESSANPMHAVLVPFTQTAMPLLVHIAVNNPGVMAAQERRAASPVHYVPANLRCTRYTSLGESSLVALDACLQYYAQSGQLRSRSNGLMPSDAAAVPASDVSCVTIEDLVRVLPTLTRVSQNSVHPSVRAVPYRCLLYISQRIEDTLVVLRDMPSLANAAVSCVLDYTAASSQWEVAAAAEWLTVLVDLLIEAEMTTTTTLANERPPPKVDTTVVGADETAADERRQQRLRYSFSPAEQLQEYFHFDDSPLARKLLTSVAAARRSDTGSAYAISALLQLAVHLQKYIDNHQRQRDAHDMQQRQQDHLVPHNTVPRQTIDETPTQPLTPAGLSSIAQWILLLQSTTADNTRLTRICAAFQRTRARQRSQVQERRENENEDVATAPSPPGRASSSKMPHQAGWKPVFKDAWVRALTASEQIALQYTFTATLFRAVDTLLLHQNSTANSYSKHFSNSLICNAVAAAVTLPSPCDVAELLSMRFHASSVTCGKDSAASSSAFFSSPALLFGYQAAIQWSCHVGAKWIRRAYPCGSNAMPKADLTPLSCAGGLPSPCSAVLMEELCSATVAIMRDSATAGLSQRTRCQAAELLSAVVEACPPAHLSLLESRGAELFASTISLRRLTCVSGLQCRLLRRVWSAARYASSSDSNWLQANLDALQSTVHRIKEGTLAGPQGRDGHRSDSPRPGRSAHQQTQSHSRSPKSHDTVGMARDLQAFQVLTTVLTSIEACAVRVTRSETSSEQPMVLLSPLQRQTLCATLCDALRVASLRHCVLTALRSVAETSEGRRCLLTEISSSGDPLGRTLFGRVLALALHMPCRWTAKRHNRHPPAFFSSSHSPQQRVHQRSPSASPRSPCPPVAANASCALQTSADVVCDNGFDVDPVAVLGAGICTFLLGQEHSEGSATVGVDSEKTLSELATTTVAVTPSMPTSSFFAAFMKHRGLEHLARAIVEHDQQQRRQGRPLAVPKHLLRVVAALSLHTVVVKDIVQNADLFSVILELAGAAFPPHATAATLALLTLRNVCFDGGLKSTLCQDARVLLTLKAAYLKLPCVHQLVEDTSTTAVWPVSCKLKGAPGANSPSSPQRHRRTRIEVALRGDVVDPENQTVVAWAKQMCMYARAWPNDPVTRAMPAHSEAGEVKISEKESGGAFLSPRRRVAFVDITNAPPHVISDISTVSSKMNDREETQMREVATDAEAFRRQYLAATALGSLWFGNQRGKSAIAEVLSSAPSCDMEEVQTLARLPLSD